MRTKMRAPVWLLVLVVCQLASCEGRYWRQEGHKDVRHRHRHQHESPSRWAHSPRRAPLLEPDDYDDSWSDSEEDESAEDEDYEFYYPRRRVPSRSPGRPYRRWQHRVQEEAPRRKSHRHHEKSRRLQGRTHQWPEDFEYESPHRRYHEDKLARKFFADGFRKHRNYEEEQSLKRLLDYISRSEARRRRVWSNSTSGSRKRNRNWEDEEEDYLYSDSESDRDEENELWKDEEEEEEPSEDEYEEEDEDQEKKAPLKTFDDIIKRLTSSDPTTPRPKKELDIARYLKRDVYGNLQLDASLNASAKSMVKSVGGPVHSKVVIDNRRRNEEVQTKDPDYDEYSNPEEDSSMQADINNADYAEEENAVDEEEEEQFSTSTVPSTTTTTAKPIVPMQHNPRDLRSYEDPAGHQSNGYHTRTEYPPMSPHSMHKWQTLGTRESVVREARGHVNNHQNRKSAEMALQHAIKVSKEGSCQWPRARVIPVQEVYPSVSTTYIPHCAILHRCTDDTGCCRSEAQTCVPKHTQKVELYFYATNVVQRTRVVEKLTFYNHTQCECRERWLEDNPGQKASDARNTETPSIPESKKPPQRKSCRCPSLFAPKVTSKGECQCNCHEKNENCIRASKGKVYFSHADQHCIQDKTCGKPGCEFGEYSKLDGRCPTKKEHLKEIGSHSRKKGVAT